MTIRSYRELIVWQKAMDLAVIIYRISDDFPKSEVYGLTSQVRRSAASVPANIAEGSARSTSKDYTNFLSIAKGSLMETETFLILASKLGYIDQAQTAPAMALITEISKMLTSMRSKLSAAHAGL